VRLLRHDTDPVVHGGEPGGPQVDAADADDEVSALRRAMTGFRPEAYDSALIRRHAESFSVAAFTRRMADLVARLLPQVPEVQ